MFRIKLNNYFENISLNKKISRTNKEKLNKIDNLRKIKKIRRIIIKIKIKPMYIHKKINKKK